MSLALTALRLQAVETLLADPGIAQLCGPLVYDERIADFDHREPVPVIVVTTESIVAKAYSANNGGSPFDLRCELVLEIAMTAVADVEGVPMLHRVGSDRDLAAFLDFLSERAVVALCEGETSQAALLRRAVTRRVPEYKSDPFRTDQTGEKFAVRYLRFAVELKGDDGEDALDPPTGPYASLPDPLRTVCEAAPSGSSAQATCQLLAGILPAPAPPPVLPFTGADLTFAPHALAPDAAPSEADDRAAAITFGVRANP
ncbi:hypothetical protein OPKNFCMD_3841 [Methylobacterium crusticola]|uniref:Uncharacterized protein n=1 Tax=Methylobacterium crusticola TaxID=1697972 RepID=A0ABQ4R090_9HYPH|nr:hypothetical protein [Methylobacterium crusticola]GJD51090.1 hypothetical protein OPKNFCMD_3841 [Methylobacterium crusticola]